MVPAELALALPRSLERQDAGSEAERAVTQLFGALRDPVLRYVTALGLRSEEAEEIVQETFIALLRHLRLGRPQTNLRGWIFRVAHNLALKRRQRSGRAPLRSLEGLALEGEARPDPAPNPEEQLAGGQRRRRLLAVVRALPERDRGCLFMRAEGLGYREIAAALGISLGAVCLSVKRSLDRLARAEGA